MSPISNHLLSATIQTFEEMCFLEGTPSELPASRMSVQASVRFRGPFCGHLTVQIPAEVLLEAARNMLGDDGSESTSNDVACEIANVICGNVLPLMATPAAVFVIEAPQAAAFSEVIEGEIAHVVVGGSIASVCLCVDAVAA